LSPCQLKHSFLAWLRSADFSPIRDRLNKCISSNSSKNKIRIVIQTESNQSILPELPWEDWEVFDSINLGNIVLSPNQFQQHSQRISLPKVVNILAILGDSTNIDIDEDRRFLEKLPNRKGIQFLAQTSRPQVRQQLWHPRQPFHILFFAGHGGYNQYEQPVIWINRQEAMKIADLKLALKQAVKKGLVIAIFNSCNSLDLARGLSDINIPIMIVMRQPVPDEVAQIF